jgi:hypothetical protein
MNILFIYENEKEVKVLTAEKAVIEHDNLIKNGFIHKATIDPVSVLQGFYNEMKKWEDRKIKYSVAKYFKL